MKDLGKVKKIRGVDIKRDRLKKKMLLSQSSYLVRKGN